MGEPAARHAQGDSHGARSYALTCFASPPREALQRRASRAVLACRPPMATADSTPQPAEAEGARTGEPRDRAATRSGWLTPESRSRRLLFAGAVYVLCLVVFA